jgi:hypothetical protein
MDLPVYVVNYKNDERKQRMKYRFNQFNIEPIFPPGIDSTDERLSTAPVGADKRVWSIMLQHLDAVRLFYEQTEQEHCIVCEDDIHISKNFLDNITFVIPKFEQLELDLLLLGFLLPFKIDMSTCLHSQHFAIIDKIDNYTIHQYPIDLWGCQMYLISRKYAKYLLETFTVQYAIENIGKIPYNPDWIITKNGNRAIIYPMIAVEEGVNVSQDQSQIGYHKLCHLVNYDPEKYI